jgi:hypothetical protein
LNQQTLNGFFQPKSNILRPQQLFIVQSGLFFCGLSLAAAESSLALMRFPERLQTSKKRPENKMWKTH